MRFSGLCIVFYFELALNVINPVSILYKTIASRYRSVGVADGPIMARYRFIKNATRASQ